MRRARTVRALWAVAPGNMAACAPLLQPVGGGGPASTALTAPLFGTRESLQSYLCMSTTMLCAHHMPP